MVGGTGFFYQACWLTVTTSRNGLMNFVDAKQQGIIRFLGQNEKLSKQLAALLDDAGRAYFATAVASDVFRVEDHPFKEEIQSGKRPIATLKVYQAIDFVRDGIIQAASDREREGRPWTAKISTWPRAIPTSTWTATRRSSPSAPKPGTAAWFTSTPTPAC